MPFLEQKRRFRWGNATKNLRGREEGEESPWLQPNVIPAQPQLDVQFAQQSLFPKQVGVSSRVHEGKRQDAIVLSVAQKPVGTDVEFSCPCERAGQFMVMKLFVKSLVRPE